MLFMVTRLGKSALLILLFFSTPCIFSQDTLNIIDAKGKKQGPWCKKDQNGIKIYEGRFTDDVPTGVFRYFYPDGKIKTVSAFYENGHKVRSVSYFKNGHMMARGNYVDEKKDSAWQFFGEFDGSLLLEESYIAGLRDGVSKTFTPDKVLVEMMHYRNGLRDGPWEQYYSDGKIKIRGSYSNDENSGTFQAFSPEGKIMISGQYTEGHRSGVWSTFDEKGTLLKKEYYRDGKLVKTEESPK
jgi:antitoxin component YwqK of YwqJK toxin-antitoxin module